MNISTSLNVLFDRNNLFEVEAMIERLAKIGFTVLDFNFCDWVFEGSPFLDNGWEQWVEKARRTADSLGISFSQSHGPIFNKFDETKNGKLNTQMSHRSIEASAILGAKWVVFEPETYFGTYDKEHLEGLKKRNMEWFCDILKTAEKVNVGIAIENVTDFFNFYNRPHWPCRSYGSTPDELISLVDEFNHPLVGICWDTGHANLQRMDQGKAIRALGNRLKVVHIQDNDRSSDQHLPPYCGSVDWEDVVSTLYEIDFEGDFTFEIASFTRPMPDSMRNAALRYVLELGQAMLERKF